MHPRRRGSRREVYGGTKVAGTRGSAAEIRGEQNADEMRMGDDGKPVFLSNNAGGIAGGISTGQQIVARFAGDISRFKILKGINDE